MEREKNIQYTEKETESLPDDSWIFANLSTLIKFAAIKFQIYGRGAILVNPRNVLQPPRYLSPEETTKEETGRLKKFVDNYDPSNGFVISIVQGKDKKNNIYQIDVVNVSQQI